MSLNFVPEYRFDTFLGASAEFLTSIGVKALVLDVDNTLEPYENPIPGEHIKTWLAELREAGISCAIVSNNGGERIELFNSELRLPCFCKARKPFSGGIKRALKVLGAAPDEAIMMGDQIFTDVWAAHNAGIRAILVPPIRDKRDLLTRFKRLLERPVLRAYDRRHKINDRKEKRI